MKIRDILSEQPSGFQAGKALAKKVTSPSQWGLGGDKDYEAGKAAVDKLFDPSQWFRGGGTQTAQAPGQQTAKRADPNQLDLGNKQPHEVRANLDAIISGNYFAADKATAKSIYDQISKGSYKPAVDIESTMGSLKKVVDGQSLSKDDIEIFKKLKSSIRNIN